MKSPLEGPLPDQWTPSQYYNPFPIGELSLDSSNSIGLLVDGYLMYLSL